MGRPVVHFEINSKDAPALRSFYGETFGWEIGEPVPGAPNSYTTIQTGVPGAISGGIGVPPDGCDVPVTFYVGVTDMPKAFTTIEKLGGSKVMGPEHVPGGPVIGYFKDPGGHVVGLVEIPE
jgi:predicted enzyme related to lactoylglutathione lyase